MVGEAEPAFNATVVGWVMACMGVTLVVVLARELRNVPGAHFVHWSWPCFALYCPVAHDVHASFSGLAAAASLRSLPAPHLTHDRRAGWSWKRPAWHEEHAAGSADAAD